MTPYFTTDHLDARQVGHDVWLLLAPLTFFDHDGSEHTVPIWTETDFASIPWGVRNLFPKSGRWNRAAALHDYQCRMRLEPSETVHDRFRRALKACGCNRFQERVMWSMVRAFGPRFEAEAPPEAAA